MHKSLPLLQLSVGRNLSVQQNAIMRPRGGNVGRKKAGLMMGTDAESAEDGGAVLSFARAFSVQHGRKRAAIDACKELETAKA
jgi:hypothetical protein